MAGSSLRTERELELKFDVADSWVLPDLAALVPPGGSIQKADVELESTYFDTDHRDLLGSGLTLRRRTGTTDEGWQLKVPDGRARTEIRAPLSGRTAPRELQQLTLGVRCGTPLRRVVVIRTRRDASMIVDADHVPLAEVVIDDVTARTVNDPVTVTTWREVEIELKHGDEALLRKAGKWLRKSGARPAKSRSKLARALGVEPAALRRSAPKTVHEALRRYLDQQHDLIKTGDLALRRGDDVVHTTRVATRRYRSVLRIFATHFGHKRARSLDAELKWYASVLGEVRDLQVLRHHLLSEVAALPAAIPLGPVSDRLTRTLDADIDKARHKLSLAMRSKRYLALLDELRSWSENTPFAIPSERVKLLARYATKAENTYRKRVRAAAALDADDPAKNDATHRARKAAKRARYTAELANQALGKDARDAARQAKKAKKVQTELGNHQDALLAMRYLHRLGMAADAQPDENGFSYGILFARAMHNGNVMHK